MAVFNDHVRVQITIESKDRTPEQISDSVGLPFDVAYRVGEPRGHMGKKWERNVWQIGESRKGTEPASAHHLLPECLDHLLRRADAVQASLAGVVASCSGEFAIHVTAASVPGVSLSADQLRRIAALGLSLDVDIILIGAGGT
jgi:hypothetical protein